MEVLKNSLKGLGVFLNKQVRYLDLVLLFDYRAYLNLVLTKVGYNVTTNNKPVAPVKGPRIFYYLGVQKYFYLFCIVWFLFYQFVYYPIIVTRDSVFLFFPDYELTTVFSLFHVYVTWLKLLLDYNSFALISENASEVVSLENWSSILQSNSVRMYNEVYVAECMHTYWDYLTPWDGVSKKANFMKRNGFRPSFRVYRRFFYYDWRTIADYNQEHAELSQSINRTVDNNWFALGSNHSPFFDQYLHITKPNGLGSFTIPQHTERFTGVEELGLKGSWVPIYRDIRSCIFDYIRYLYRLTCAHIWWWKTAIPMFYNTVNWYFVWECVKYYMPLYFDMHPDDWAIYWNRNAPYAWKSPKMPTIPFSLDKYNTFLLTPVSITSRDLSGVVYLFFSTILGLYSYAVNIFDTTLNVLVWVMSLDFSVYFVSFLDGYFGLLFTAPFFTSVYYVLYSIFFVFYGLVFLLDLIVRLSLFAIFFIGFPVLTIIKLSLGVMLTLGFALFFSIVFCLLYVVYSFNFLLLLPKLLGQVLVYFLDLPAGYMFSWLFIHIIGLYILYFFAVLRRFFYIKDIILLAYDLLIWAIISFIGMTKLVDFPAVMRSLYTTVSTGKFFINYRDLKGDGREVKEKVKENIAGIAGKDYSLGSRIFICILLFFAFTSKVVTNFFFKTSLYMTKFFFTYIISPKYRDVNEGSTYIKGYSVATEPGQYNFGLFSPYYYLKRRTKGIWRYKDYIPDKVNDVYRHPTAESALRKAYFWPLKSWEKMVCKRPKGYRNYDGLMNKKILKGRMRLELNLRRKWNWYLDAPRWRGFYYKKNFVGPEYLREAEYWYDFVVKFFLPVYIAIFLILCLLVIYWVTCKEAATRERPKTSVYADWKLFDNLYYWVGSFFVFTLLFDQVNFFFEMPFLTFWKDLSFMDRSTIEFLGEAPLDYWEVQALGDRPVVRDGLESHIGRISKSWREEPNLYYGPSFFVRIVKYVAGFKSSE